jgi:hypothetical protein
MKTLAMAAIGITAALISMQSSGAARVYPLLITAPFNDTVVAPGQTVTIKVTVESGYTFPNGVAIFGGQPSGAVVMAGPLAQSSLSFSVTIPANANEGPLTITAAGTDSSGTLDNSAPITLDVEQTNTPPVSLRVDPPSMHFAYIGQTLPLNVIGVFANGSWGGLTQSSQLQMSSNNTAVVTVTNGSITASGAGNADIQISYGSLTATVPVYVPNTSAPGS